MEYYGKRIVCKSTNENFNKEKSGVKNNTIREITEKENIDFKLIQDVLQRQENPMIVIRNTRTGEFIERKITDITLFKQFEEEDTRVDSETHKKTIFKDTKYIYIISFKK